MTTIVDVVDVPSVEELTAENKNLLFALRCHGRAIEELDAQNVELRAACRLALDHCEFPVGAMKAKRALEEALEED